MTIVMQIALWVAMTFGLPIPDNALPEGACGSAVPTAGTASSTACPTQRQNMRKAWRIYNGF